MIYISHTDTFHMCLAFCKYDFISDPYYIDSYSTGACKTISEFIHIGIF